MKDAIISYRKHNQDLSSADIASHFTKQWHITLTEELIESILNEDLLESETGASGCNINEVDVKEKVRNHTVFLIHFVPCNLLIHADLSAV